VTSPRARDRRPASRGFTLLEILIAMAIFTVLGTMVVYFMRQSLNIFTMGTKESGYLDRLDMVLPQVRDDLQGLIVPAEVEPPPPRLDVLDLRRRGLKEPPPPPPVLIRLRAGYVKLRNVGESGPPDAPSLYRDYPCPYIAFVVADAGEWSHKLKRRAGEAPVAAGGLKPLTTGTVGDASSLYLPTVGLTEIVWIAIPKDLVEPPGKDEPRYPAILTLCSGFRTPIGDPEKSLLNPENLDTVAKILGTKDKPGACTVKARDLLHFGAIWRRVTAKDWTSGVGVGTGDDAPYVGPVWDSTRALDSTWPLHKGKESLSDPSDDIFPAFVMLEATLAPTIQGSAGRGELYLREDISADDTRIKVNDTDVLMQPNLGTDRWLKVGREWMRYRVRDVDYVGKTVRVARGQRGTKKRAHRSRDWGYVGLPSRLQMRLPVYLDRYVLPKGEK
jgi:prepilin-type N-terminal cleavage/methylation domain-containing protein